ncbi:circularly permuted type 2 ATP-grasp protein [Rosistilla oblonga]|uniref:circularly permuted type 2 ATP-grasp protein n=2 Tax=Rosistilla oblonga TaxID=2527990 RepID=UPI003A96E533
MATWKNMQTQQQGSLPDPQTAAVISVFAGYSPPVGSYDELFAAPQQMRSHWKRFAAAINRVGNEEMLRRWTQAKRLIHENGVTYGAYGDPLDKPRPWELDALPLIIPQKEWGNLSAGLQQRAKVLELTLADLYGPKKLIRDGVLPPEIIFAHPGFHTTLHNLKPSMGRYLHSYAADLGRAPDGGWWLLADRTEAPSGAGYALENRVVESRMLPEGFRACNVQRLAPYFRALRETCRRIATRHKDNPRIVLLSQGPSSENYFEDAYLSRYLGYTLVEGADLAVRDRCVWLKTLGGLYPVDVILRRPNTVDCDSLELPSSSPGAIAGLVDAAAAGNVAITNPLGCGLVESPIFMAYIGALCKTLLGEDLKLSSVATWWCGDAVGREYVLANLDRLVIKRAFRQRGHERQVTEHLKQLPNDQLAERIKARPWEFVGQERVVRSTMPNWGGGNVSAAYLAMRAYMIASGDSFEVMHGGLARTSTELGSLEMSLVSGEGSKDIWIQGKEPPQHDSLFQGRHEPVKLRRSGDDLPSRVADDIYWLGRQVERADSAARLLRAVTMRLTSESASHLRSELPMLLRTMADQGQIEPGFVVEGIRQQLPAIEENLPISTFDATASGSLRSMLAATYSTASRVRDRLSADSWRVLVRIDEQFRAPATGTWDLTDLLNMSNELIVDLVAFIGMMSESMTRTQAFHFMDLGLRIERATQTTSLLNNCFSVGQEITGEMLEALLQVCDSLMTYRYRYLSNLNEVPVLDLLLTDETNPRSVVYQLLRIKDHVDRLPRTESQPTSSEQRMLLSALYAVRMLDIEAIGENHSEDRRRELVEVFEKLEQHLPQLSQAITNKYMVHAGPSRLLTSIDQVRMSKP